MARTKLNPEFQIEVDGETYVWRLQRTPHWSKDPVERHGMTFPVGAAFKDARMSFDRLVRCC